MKRFVKEQKGITLIALIITIIVMLILVAVTINVALNGGLFDKARQAAKDTQREADKEELLVAVVSTYDSITKTNLERELGTDKWTVVDNEDGTFTCTKKSTNNSFTIEGTTETDEEGENTEPSNPQDPEETEEINEYGFYFNKEYICNSYQGMDGDTMKVTIPSDGGIIANGKCKRSDGAYWVEGQTFSLTDLAGVVKVSGDSLQFNNPYTYTGTFGESYTCIFKNDGLEYLEIVFSDSILELSDKLIVIAGMVQIPFSEDGTIFSLNGNTYKLIED